MSVSGNDTLLLSIFTIRDEAIKRQQFSLNPAVADSVDINEALDCCFRVKSAAVVPSSQRVTGVFLYIFKLKTQIIGTLQQQIIEKIQSWKVRKICLFVFPFVVIFVNVHETRG